jgi:hypothetical protein
MRRLGAFGAFLLMVFVVAGAIVPALLPQGVSWG